MIVGLIKPNEGSIFLEDQELTNEPVYKRAQKGSATWLRKLRYSADCRSRTTSGPSCR